MMSAADWVDNYLLACQLLGLAIAVVLTLVLVVVVIGIFVAAIVEGVKSFL